MDARNQFLQGGAGQNFSGLQKLEVPGQRMDESDNYGFWDGFKDIGMSTLSGAGSGAATGALLGGVGAVPGAIVGGLIGLGSGIWSAVKSNNADEEAQAAAAEYNANQESLRIQNNFIKQRSNELLIKSFEGKTREDNLSSYYNAIGSEYQYI
jgi:phage tail tape-measure protein